MEPVLQQIMAEVNGRYTLSNILDVLDKLRSKLYKYYIQELKELIQINMIKSTNTLLRNQEKKVISGINDMYQSNKLKN